MADARHAPTRLNCRRRQRQDQRSAVGGGTCPAHARELALKLGIASGLPRLPRCARLHARRTTYPAGNFPHPEQALGQPAQRRHQLLPLVERDPVLNKIAPKRVTILPTERTTGRDGPAHVFKARRPDNVAGEGRDVPFHRVRPAAGRTPHQPTRTQEPHAGSWASPANRAIGAKVKPAARGQSVARPDQARRRRRQSATPATSTPLQATTPAGSGIAEVIALR